jgi:putative oxidoreductase
MSYGILLLRVALGLSVAAHGAQKIFGAFGGHGPRGTAGYFGNPARTGDDEGVRRAA